MSEKPKEERVGDLKAKSLGDEAEKVKGGAEPVGARKAEPIAGSPKPAEPIGASKIL